MRPSPFETEVLLCSPPLSLAVFLSSSLPSSVPSDQLELLELCLLWWNSAALANHMGSSKCFFESPPSSFMLSAPAAHTHTQTQRETVLTVDPSLWRRGCFFPNGQIHHMLESGESVREREGWAAPSLVSWCRGNQRSWAGAERLLKFRVRNYYRSQQLTIPLQSLWCGDSV